MTQCEWYKALQIQRFFTYLFITSWNDTHAAWCRTGNSRFQSYLLQVQLENKCKEIKDMGRYFCKIKSILFFSVVGSNEGQNLWIIELHSPIMGLHISIHKAPHISNYAALFELWGHQNSHIKFCFTPFFNQAGIFFNQSRVRLTEASFFRPNYPRTPQRNETVKLSRRKWLWRVIQSSGRHENDAGHGETIPDTVT